MTIFSNVYKLQTDKEKGDFLFKMLIITNYLFYLEVTDEIYVIYFAEMRTWIERYSAFVNTTSDDTNCFHWSRILGGVGVGILF